MLTKEFRGTIISYEQTAAGLQFELDSFSGVEREPIKSVITERIVWTGKDIETRLKNCELGLVVQVWVEYQQGTVEDDMKEADGMERIKKIIGMLFMIVLLSDCLIYGSSTLFAERVLDLYMGQNGAQVLYATNTAELNGSKKYNGILYIIEKGNSVVFRYAKPVKTNYFLSNVWGDSVAYIPTKEQYTLDLVAKEIKEIENDYLNNHGVFLLSSSASFQKIAFVGAALQEQQMEDLQLKFQKAFCCADTETVWVFAGSMDKDADNAELFIFQQF